MFRLVACLYASSSFALLQSAAPSVPVPVPEKLSTTAAREALLASLSDRSPSRKSVVIDATDALLGANTCNYETSQFVEFALNGEWVLEESSSRRDQEALRQLGVDRDLEVGAICQTITAESGRGKLTNKIHWKRPLAGDAGYLLACCDLEMTVSVNRLSTWTLSFGETKHSIHPDKKLTTDVVEIVDSVARLAPFELFDPHGTMLDLEYVDPELRVMGVALASKRGGNNLHVFSRPNGPWGLSPGS